MLTKQSSQQHDYQHGGAKVPTVLIVILLAFSDLRVRECNKEFKKGKGIKRISEE